MTPFATIQDIKILLVVHQFFPDHGAGTEVLTLSVARELLARGYDVRVFTGHPSSTDLSEAMRFDEYDYEGIPIYRFHHAYTPMFGQTSIMELSFDNHLAAHHFDKVLMHFQPDWVHFFHLHHLGIGLIDSTFKAGVPAFMTPTDFWGVCATGQLVLCNGGLCSGPTAFAGNCVKHIAESRQKGFKSMIAAKIPVSCIEFLARLTLRYRLNYPYSAEILATSKRLQQAMSRLNRLTKIVSPNSFMSENLVKHGLKSELIIEAAFGIDQVQNVEIASRQITRNPLRIGFIGTFVKDKGCHVLIEAFHALPVGSAILNIYGKAEKFPEYASQLKRLARNSEAITFCGTFPNAKINEVLADLDVLVVPSLWYENTPLVVYSAQAARCPVIASDFPGLSEVIQDQVNGLLFPPGNVIALTKLLRRFIDEPDIARQLSAGSIMPKQTSEYVDELLAIWQASGNSV